MDYIEVGKVVNTHGIRGEIKLNPWTDNLPEITEIDTFYLKDKDGFRPLHAERVRIHKNCAIIKAAGIDDMNAAEQLRGRVLYVEKMEELPEGRYYIADLIGLSVKTEEGEIGILSDVLQTGAHDVYEITTTEGKKALLPAVSQFVEEINMDARYIRVRLIEGILD
ncbi:MAG: 16S rRNA processing protein RimM [Ruminococcaceae bacterium]|nr:16S rRNA processing protein RimM [Oscillospiraceae bacterium]